jgi:hypothetical protein
MRPQRQLPALDEGTFFFVPPVYTSFMERQGSSKSHLA